MSDSSKHFTRCWACQEQIAANYRVYIDQSTTIPCCLQCWETIPAGQRIVLAQKFQSGDALQVVLRYFAEILKDHIDTNFLPEWWKREIDPDEFGRGEGDLN